VHRAHSRPLRVGGQLLVAIETHETTENQISLYEASMLQLAIARHMRSAVVLSFMCH
jgi:hypothetical protein